MLPFLLCIIIYRFKIERYQTEKRINMAFQMIHMEIAYRICKRSPQIQHVAEFILGSVAPDSVHMNPDFDINKKVKSHMFEGCGKWSDTQDYQRWDKNITQVLKQNEYTGKKKDFVTGLGVHCMTDYWNDLNIWRKLQKEYLPQLGMEGFKPAYYKEARGIDLWLHQNSRNTSEIMQYLTEAEAFTIDGLVEKSEVEQQRKHLLYTQYNIDSIDISDFRFLSAPKIDTFINETVTAIVEKQLF